MIDPTELEVGGAYLLSKDTYLMPHPDPEDPMAELRKVKTIRAGGSIAILEAAKFKTGRWYKVATLFSGEVTYTGWVKTNALVGQSLKRMKVDE